MSSPAQKGPTVAVLDAVQELADGLAAELNRSVAVDDPQLRLLASSAHYEDVDPARLDSLLGRRINGPTLTYVMDAGAQQWRAPTHLEANPDLGVAYARWGFPLRSKFGLLGFMWLIDDGAIGERELAVAAETARRIEHVLARQSRTTMTADPQVEALVDGLLARERHDREDAAADLLGRGLFCRATSLAALVIRTASQDPTRGVGTDAEAVRRGLADALQNRLRETFAFSVGDTESVLVVGARLELPVDDLMAMATGVHQEIARCDPALSAATRIGVGAPVNALADIHQAHRQAAVAAEIALARREVAAAWDAHPLEGMLRGSLRPDVPAALVPAVLHRLQEQPADMLQVIATYLDQAGNVNATADLMHLHRTTIYYRLEKFRERTGLDLDDGRTRLLVHLWLSAKHLMGAETDGSIDP